MNRVLVTGGAGTIGAAVVRRLLRDPAWEVRAQAAKALGRSQALAAIPALAEALSDSTFWVRQNSAEALGALGPAGLAQLQQRAMRDSDPFARDAARQVLQQRVLPAARRAAG